MLHCRYVLQVSEPETLTDIILGKYWVLSSSLPPSPSPSVMYVLWARLCEGLCGSGILDCPLLLFPIESWASLARLWTRGSQPRPIFNHIKCITSRYVTLRVTSNLHGAAGADGDQHKRRDTNLRSMTARFDEGMGGGRERDLIISGAMFRSVAQSSPSSLLPTPELMRIILLQESPAGI